MSASGDLASRIRAAGGIVLLAGDAVAAEAGIAARPRTIGWDAYGPRMRRIHATEPGPGHVAARRLQDLGLLVCIVTVGDDVLFEEAGVRDVVALMGSVELSICAACGYNEPLGCVLELLPRPRCAACGGDLRPDVTVAGEPPREEEMARAREAVHATSLAVMAGDVPADGPLRELCAESRSVAVLGKSSPGAVLAAAVRELEL